MIARDVNYGWLIRYIHANVASFFFIFVYAHIGRGLYYGSYKSPRTLPWSIGVIILVIIIGVAFLGKHNSPIWYNDNNITYCLVTSIILRHQRSIFVIFDNLNTL